MIELLLVAALAGAKPAPVVQPPVQPLSEATHAIQAGRLDQARLMIGNAVKAGARGPEVDRLVADLSYASGGYAGALPRYLQLLVVNPGDGVLYERAGLSAMQVRDVTQAEKLLERATTFPTAT